MRLDTSKIDTNMDKPHFRQNIRRDWLGRRSVEGDYCLVSALAGQRVGVTGRENGYNANPSYFVTIKITTNSSYNS